MYYEELFRNSYGLLYSGDRRVQVSGAALCRDILRSLHKQCRDDEAVFLVKYIAYETKVMVRVRKCLSLPIEDSAKALYKILVDLVEQGAQYTLQIQVAYLLRQRLRVLHKLDNKDKRTNYLR